MKTLGRLLSKVSIRESKVSLETPVLGIAARAADVKKGEIFFALRGTKTNAELLIPEALERGAIVIVESAEAFEKFPNTLWVDAIRPIVGVVASEWNGCPTSRFPLVGVTGTNGKTSSTFFLDAIWKKMGLKTGLVGTIETRIGNKRIESQLTTPGPLELQNTFGEMVKAGVQYAAMEVTSIALDQYRVGGTTFAAALFTNFTRDHLDYHGDFEAYFQAKLRLFKDYSIPVAVINIDDPAGVRLQKEGLAKNWITYSLKGPATVSVKNIELLPGGTRADILTPSGSFPFQSEMIGIHNLYNAVGVLATVWGLGQDIEKGILALSNFPGAPGRLERPLVGKGLPHVFVDYAHTDDALDNVLRALSELKENQKKGRIITVFGCGGDRDRTKRPLMAKVASRWSDIVVATSDNPRTENPETIIDEIEPGIEKSKVQYYRDSRRLEAIHWALKQATSEDLVLIAGKGHENYQILATGKIPFDDREVVRDYYSLN